jgi:hydroxypyruvate isomerase
MPKFAANLSLMYTEHAFIDRFEAAARDGFEAVECLFPYDVPVAELKARLQGNGLRQVLFNAPPGDGTQGERGLACLPGREAAFREGIEHALALAAEIGCPRLHVMAGIAPPEVDRAWLRECYVANLDWAAGHAAPLGIELTIEPINTRDIPGYFLNRQSEAHAVVVELGRPNLKVQMDLYHCQIVEGDVEMKLRQYLPSGRVGHMQVAGVPQRHEPDVGELNCAHLFDVIDELGWSGHIGCEYRPRAGTSAGLGWWRQRSA